MDSLESCLLHSQVVTNVSTLRREGFKIIFLLQLVRQLGWGPRVEHPFLDMRSRCWSIWALGLSSLTGASYLSNLSLFVHCSSLLPSFSTLWSYYILLLMLHSCLRAWDLYVSLHRGDFLHCFPLLCPTMSGSPKPQPRTLDSWGKEMLWRFLEAIYVWWCFGATFEMSRGLFGDVWVKTDEPQ